MALASVGWELVVTLIDSGANTTQKIYELRSADAAAAATDAAAVLAQIALVSDAVVSQYRLAEVFEEGALSLPGSAEVETVASITGFISGMGNKKANFGIPAPKAGVFLATSGSNRNVVNIATGSIVADYAAAVYQAAGKAYISDGEVLGALIRGIRTTRASRQA